MKEKAYPYKVTTAGDPLQVVSVAEVKSWLKLPTKENPALDLELTLLIGTAVTIAESRARIELSEKTITTYRDFWGEVRNGVASRIRLRRRPISSVVVKYFDEDDVLQTLDGSTYDLCEDVFYNYFAFREELPTPSYNDNCIQIEMEVGYATANVPAELKLAILNHVASMFMNRGDASDDNFNGIPSTSIDVYRKYKPIELGV